jgi:DNA-binding XRE family transcriptional regulator
MIKDIPNFEGKYAVEEDGTIWSFPKGTMKNLRKLKPRMRKNGYQAVVLCDGNKTHSFYVHRLVVMTFLGLVDKMDVNHKNGNRSDNRLENLEICTRSKNICHGMWVNKNGEAKLTHEQSLEVKRLHMVGEKQTNIAKKFGVSKQVINYIVKNKTFKNSSIALEYGV